MMKTPAELNSERKVLKACIRGAEGSLKTFWQRKIKAIDHTLAELKNSRKLKKERT